MIIRVKVKPNSSEQKIELSGEKSYIIHLTNPPENNRANTELINLLAKFFKTSVGGIRIKAGLKSRNKVIEVI